MPSRQHLQHPLVRTDSSTLCENVCVEISLRQCLFVDPAPPANPLGAPLQTEQQTSATTDTGARDTSRAAITHNTASGQRHHPLLGPWRFKIPAQTGASRQLQLICAAVQKPSSQCPEVSGLDSSTATKQSSNHQDHHPYHEGHSKGVTHHHSTNNCGVMECHTVPVGASCVSVAQHAPVQLCRDATRQCACVRVHRHHQKKPATTNQPTNQPSNPPACTGHPTIRPFFPGPAKQLCKTDDEAR